MPRVLFLGASVSQVDAIRRARDLGFQVVAIDADPAAVGFGEADVTEAVDFSDVGAVIEVARRHRVDGVIAVSTDRAVPVAAAVAEELGLPGIGRRAALAMTNKHLMREQLELAGIPQPRHVRLSGVAAAAGALAAVGQPAVLKPVDSGGQRGVFLVETLAELRHVLPEALSHSRSHEAILEQYLPGGELNGIVVVTGGDAHVVTLSDRLRPPGRGFGVGWIHLFPSMLEPARLERAAEVAAEAVLALGLRDGIGFPQLIATSSDVQVVEVAARIPAGQMADLVRIGVGVDLFEIALRQATGEPVGPQFWRPKFQLPLAIRFFTASPGVLPVGRIRSINGLDRVRKARGVIKADLYMRPGETVHPVQVDADRRGYVLATATDPQEALRLASDATHELEVEIEH